MAPKKGSCGDSHDPPKQLWDPETALFLGDFKNKILTDTTGKKWKLGNNVGIGGFGEIYDVSEKISKPVKSTTNYVAKIEKHTNGPLFVEIHCYLRMAKLEMIEQWKRDKNLTFLGIPHFIASGSHILKGEKFRFLILPKYMEDLEAVQRRKRLWNVKTVLVIASRIIDTLEYIHSHGYVHSDIKASNIMLGRRKPSKRPSREKYPVKRMMISQLKPPKPIPRTCARTLRSSNHHQTYIDDIPYLDYILNEYENIKTKHDNDLGVEESYSKSKLSSEFEGDQVYLLDYGLATKYILSNGELREFCSDQRRAHAGTVLFCSRDAHQGIRSSRSDLESLAYNMIYWLTGGLPWMDDVDYPEVVAKKKTTFFFDVDTYLGICFRERPRFMVEMLSYLNKLEFDDTPSYDFFRILFKKTIKDYGYQDDGKVDFENLEGAGKKEAKTVMKSKNENESIFRKSSILLDSPLRKPLTSNIIFKRPKLRKKVNDKLEKNSMMNWSKILVMDPETIIKQGGGSRKNTDGDGCGVLDIDLDSLNPTPAMREVFQKASEREDNSLSSSWGDELWSVDNIEGYTPEMMRLHRRILEQRRCEFEKAVQASITVKKRGRKRIKRSESSIRTKSRSKVNEGSSSVHALKKVKSVPLKRTYSLRG